MYALTTYEQTAVNDPINPNQISREALVGIPGGWGSYYWNKVPTGSSLNGLRGFSDIPVLGQALIVGGLAAVIGFFGVRHVGPKLGLSGARSRSKRSR